VPPRFKRPASDTDEGGLWGLMDREETRLKRSPLTIQDKDLRAYLSDLVCRLSEGHCADIRVHPVRVPQFNAMMAPNGMMLVWSGLMLRVDNEAQLAAVLGTSWATTWSGTRWSSCAPAKDRAVLSTMVGMVGGVGTVVGQIGLLADMFAFSRSTSSAPTAWACG
jgi:predicted Zn-dependent protease